MHTSLLEGAFTTQASVLNANNVSVSLRTLCLHDERNNARKNCKVNTQRLVCEQSLTSIFPCVDSILFILSALNSAHDSRPKCVSFLWSLSLSLQSVPRWKKVALYVLEELMFWCSLVGADRPPKQAMPVARQEDLGLCVLWSLSLSLQSVPRCKKAALYI